MSNHPTVVKRIAALAKALGVDYRIVPIEQQPPVKNAERVNPTAWLKITKRISIGIFKGADRKTCARVVADGKHQWYHLVARKLEDVETLQADIVAAAIWLKTKGMRLPPKLDLKRPAKDKLIKAGIPVYATVSGTLDVCGSIAQYIREKDGTLYLYIQWFPQLWSKAMTKENVDRFTGYRGQVNLVQWPEHTKPLVPGRIGLAM